MSIRSSWTIRNVASVLIVLGVASLSPADDFLPPVLFVDADAPPGGDGGAWGTAYNDLQDALDAAADSGGTITEIWVAAGSYYPSEETDPGEPRSATFQLLDGVSIYGGLAGDEAPETSDLDDRDFIANETVLSGDIGVGGDDSDNSYHVVIVDASVTDEQNTILDGFTITGGNANGGSSPDSMGGGMYIEGSLTIRNCAFISNAAANWGAGLRIPSGSQTFVNCTFMQNSAGIDGGAMDASSQALQMFDCTIWGNTAGTSVGGGFAWGGVSATLVNTLFSGNSAGDHGGGICTWGVDLELVNCSLAGNTADGTTGGIFGYSGISSLTLANCVLWGNSDSGGSDESAQIFTEGGSVSVNYSCIQGWTGDLGGAGNHGDDPLFIDADGADDVPGTEDDNLRLLPGSLCINTGDPDFAPEPGETDLDGHARILCDRVDMGAYEFGIGDYDCDRVVELDDFLSWSDCMTGPGGGPYPDGCEAFDFEYDNDVDLQDFAGFQDVLSGE